MKFSFFAIFILTLLNPNIGFSKVSKLNREKLLYVIESSGILENDHEVKRLLEETQKHIKPKVLQGGQGLLFRKYISLYLQEKLNDDEAQALHQLFQSPFLGKMSREYFKDFTGGKLFDQFLASDGHLANKERALMLTKINSLILWAPHLPYGRKEMRKLEMAILTMKRGATLQSHEFDKKLQAEYLKKYSEDDAFLARQTIQALYYKTQGVRHSELKEFLRLYMDKKALIKFYKINNDAIKSFFFKLYQANVQ